MAAPPTTTRATPSGIPLWDGYQALIGFARDTDVSFWEKTVQPPGIDGGDAIDQKTMHSVLYAVKRPQVLLEITDASATVAYDPNVWNNIVSNLVNKNGGITWTFPDGSTLDVWGYLRTIEKSDLEMGEQPEADITIVITNWDPTNNVEAGPVLTSVAGT